MFDRSTKSQNGPNYPVLLHIITKIHELSGRENSHMQCIIRSNLDYTFPWMIVMSFCFTTPL